MPIWKYPKIDVALPNKTKLDVLELIELKTNATYIHCDAAAARWMDSQFDSQNRDSRKRVSWQKADDEKADLKKAASVRKRECERESDRNRRYNQ